MMCFRYLFGVILINQVYTTSVNRPCLLQNATWNQTAAITSDFNLAGILPHRMFIDQHDYIYTTTDQYNRILVWKNESSILQQSPPLPLYSYTTLFATSDQFVYFEHRNQSGQINKWRHNSTRSEFVIKFNGHCFGLFIDNQSNLYCSLLHEHRVVKMSLVVPNDNANTVAGTGCSGGAHHQLFQPWRIYVDAERRLYVADAGNHRVQVFEQGNAQGKTIAGNEIPGCLQLRFPTDVTMDGNHYLYIADYNNHRVIRVEGNGYRRIAGCTRTDGRLPGELLRPYTIGLDTRGHLYVVDESGRGIRKFQLLTGECDTVTNRTKTSTNVEQKCKHGSVCENDSTAFGGFKCQCATGFNGTYCELDQRVVQPMTHSANITHALPLLCHNAAWNRTVATLFNQSHSSKTPRGLFIDHRDHIYVANHQHGKILVWEQETAAPTRVLEVKLFAYTTLFVTTNGDVYFEHGNRKGQINKWPHGSTDSEFVAQFIGHCFGLFIDMESSLYCSMRDEHRVVKVSLIVKNATAITVAGTGCAGGTHSQLNRPWGIYVDAKLRLYIADAGNDRIQVFEHGQTCGRKIAGEGIPGCLQLRSPTDVIMDGNNYLYIADNEKHRVIRVEGDQYRCIAGCKIGPGSTLDELHKPYGIRLNRRGDLYVSDESNRRIQKFQLTTNGTGACGKIYTEVNDTHHPIDLFQPCKNRGTCIEQSNHTCSCFPGFNGSICEIDQRSSSSELVNNAVTHALPRLCHNAAWNRTAVTLFTKSRTGQTPRGLFIDHRDHIYVANHQHGKILVWEQETAAPTRVLEVNLFAYTTLFVTTNGDVYFEHGNRKGQINKWPYGSTDSEFVVQFIGHCFGLFIDMESSLYCSMRDEHRVVKVSLIVKNATAITVAGTGCAGGTHSQLNQPWGIYVDAKLNLYVADAANSRIQLFTTGQREGKTIAGRNRPSGLYLKYPTDVILNRDGVVYIADNQHDRVIQASPSGYQCLVGCNRTHGSKSDEFKRVYSIRLDSCGHLYVADEFNDRVQKFELIPNGCNDPPTVVFVAPSCHHPGSRYDIFREYCRVVKPCHEDETCRYNQSSPQGYTCTCSSESNSSHCRTSEQSYRPNPCWNNGTLNSTDAEEDSCTCDLSWEGRLCERKTNYCFNITCENNGVCRPLFGNYTCECLGSNYYGRHCEHTSAKVILFRAVSKSMAYVAILVMVVFAMFIIIMDILKYGFGIDPVRGEHEKIRRARRRRRPVVERFAYVNAPLGTRLPKKTIPTITVTET